MTRQQQDDFEDCAMGWFFILLCCSTTIFVLFVLYLFYSDGTLVYLLLGLGFLCLPPYICYLVKQWRKK